MSLLIKALAAAEKDKQKVEKSVRTPPGEPLSLSPLASELDVTRTTGADVGVVTDQPDRLTLTSGEDVSDHIDLSLDEEAGFMRPDMKRKAGMPQVAKSAKVNAKTDSFHAATQASEAGLKVQADVAKMHQKAAASVFVANHAVKTPTSPMALFLVAVAGTVIVLLGLQGYQYIQALGTSEVLVVTPASTATATVAPIAGGVSNEPVADAVGEQSIAGGHTDSVAGEVLAEPTVQDGVSDVKSERIKPILVKHQLAEKADKRISAADPAMGDVVSVTQSPALHQSAQFDEGARREVSFAEPKQPLKLVTKVQAAGVDPALLAAYEAFRRGDDASAQQKYRQVLQKDVRNVDALLGMAAIAQRQGRAMDAIGWYRKVTDIEPRNSIAQSALTDLEATTDVVATESKIKSMLARQPEAANLHAALGNLYAAQNQWAAAQAAYFSASQFAPISADYAFNLAISLEHLGKPQLALVQYQRALDLLNMTGATSPDRTQLEARVLALQQ